MAAANPHAHTKHGPVWDEGYQEGLKGAGGMFGQPPAMLSPDSVKPWKDGYKAGRLDAKHGVKASHAEPPHPNSGSQHEAAHHPDHRQVWTFTIDGRQLHNVSTAEAKGVLEKIAQRLERRVESLEFYQIAFDQSASSHVMSLIIETASGFHYEPDAAIWATLKKQVGAAHSAAASGRISDAAKDITKASRDIEDAATAWMKFLDNFNMGGDHTVHGLEHVVKACITIEVVGAGVLTGGVAAEAAIGAGGNGLNEAADQYFAVLEGKSPHMDWKKIGIDSAIGLVLGAAGGALEPKWAELCARQAPRLVGANTPMLEKIGATLIDSETGTVYTAAELAVKLEPLWGKIVTKIPTSELHHVIEELLKRGLEGDKHPESFAHKILEEVREDIWAEIIKSVVEDG